MQINQGDHVDRVREMWAREMPGLDTRPVAVVARLGRLHAYLDQRLDAVFREYGLTRQDWDVLASLRRGGEPHRLRPTELYRGMMRTSGAITHTLHRLEYAGLIERVDCPEDGRSLLVQLTEEGRALTEEIIPTHLDNERRLLAPLEPEEQEALAGLLRRLLVALEGEDPLPPATVPTRFGRAGHGSRRRRGGGGRRGS